MAAKFTFKITIGVIILLCVFIALIAFSPWVRFYGKGVPQDKALRGIAWFNFGQKNALVGWEEKIFKGRVIYSIKPDRIGRVLDAYSSNAASGLLYWLNFNPSIQPMVSWKWKVLKFPDRKKGASEGSWWLEKDDYAARFYVIFPRFPIFRLQCLEYVWDKNLPKGAVLTNPNFTNLKIIVVESGEENLGRWVYVERNIYEDFKKYFGKSPGNVGAIAIMTDSDNTASVAQAQYNDIEVGYAK